MSAKIENIVWSEILHSDRFGDAFVKGFADFLARLFLEDRTQNVEIPIVVEPERARSMAAACWLQSLLPRRFKIHRVINARTRAKNIDNSRPLFLLRQRIGRVIDLRPDRRAPLASRYSAAGRWVDVWVVDPGPPPCSSGAFTVVAR